MRKRPSKTGQPSTPKTIEGVSELKTLPENVVYACPECKGQELRMAVLLSGMVTYRFSGTSDKELVNAGEFASDTPSAGRCECVKCGWIGVTAEATVSSSDRLTWRLSDAFCD